MRRHVGGALLAVVAGALLLNPGPALGDVERRDDPRGDQGPMPVDVRQIWHSWGRTQDRLVHAFRADERFFAGTFAGRGIEARFSFDLRGGDAAECSVIVRATEDGFTGALFRGGRPTHPWLRRPEQRLGSVDVRRAGLRSIEVRLRADQLPGSRPYTWSLEVYGPAYRDFCGAGPGGADRPPCYDGTRWLTRRR